MAKGGIAFLGGGIMAEAMIRAVLDRHVFTPTQVAVTGPRRERRAELAKQFGVTALASSYVAMNDQGGVGQSAWASANGTTWTPYASNAGQGAGPAVASWTPLSVPTCRPWSVKALVPAVPRR